MANSNPFGAITDLEIDGTSYRYADITALEDAGLCELDRLPISIRILLESVLRKVDGETITEADVENVASWQPVVPQVDIPFSPSRVLLQDLTGVPAVVDLAALRSAMDRHGGDPEAIEPDIPCDLVIDHSVQVDYFGSEEAYERNVEIEYERNEERYRALKWAQQAFDGMEVVPPGVGIVHQVNLEFLSQVVHDRRRDGERWLLPDTLVGTDSHTPMVGGIGVVGWGVGGIEAEAALLGQAISMPLPEVVGVKLTGTIPEGVTATDVVLTITDQLRDVGVVDRFVEFYGPGIDELSVPDRATIANMAPEQGSTISLFPIDERTLEYLELTGRDPGHIEVVRHYLEAQGLFGEQDPEFTETVEIDLGEVVPSLAGPKRPHDRIPLTGMEPHIQEMVEAADGSNPDRGSDTVGTEGEAGADTGSGAVAIEQNAARAETGIEIELDDGRLSTIDHGSVVVSAITSCTNTSNPSVMVAAGLLAKNAIEAGLTVPPHVKTSLAPGSRVVTEYLEHAGLMPALEELGYHLVGYGCTTCIGNTGPLPPAVEAAIDEHDLWTTSVLSGNRNFEARIHPKVQGNYLASPPLVVAYGLAGRMDLDLETDPLGVDANGEPVFLSDVWPSSDDIRDTIQQSINADMYAEKYANAFEGDARWQDLEAPTGAVYDWDPSSTYIREPPFFTDFPAVPPGVEDIHGARCLMLLGDTVTTDHISPAGLFGPDTPAGDWLMEQDVNPDSFNTYGSRRGNHEVMMRGTLANVRIRNEMLDDIEGGYTVHYPSDEVMTVFEASERYRADDVPLILMAGEEFGTGSSRDWAAKGVDLLGVEATIAESYERIFRDNLIGMGVVPLRFQAGDSWQSLGLDGSETYTIDGFSAPVTDVETVSVRAERSDGSTVEFEAEPLVTTPAGARYLEHGGILHALLRQVLADELPE